MSYLGYANPFYHLGRIIHEYLAAPLPHRPMPADFYIIGHRGVPLVAPRGSVVSAIRSSMTSSGDLGAAQTSLKRYGLRMSRRSSWV